MALHFSGWLEEVSIWLVSDLEEKSVDVWIRQQLFVAAPPIIMV